MAIQHYRDLVVWQKAMNLADNVFAISEKMPNTQRYVMCSQVERSALSVPANIAEGRSRHSKNDFIYHLNVARGSLAELETILMLAARRKYITQKAVDDCLHQSEEITKMLHGLITRIRESNSSKLKP